MSRKYLSKLLSFLVLLLGAALVIAACGGAAPAGDGAASSGEKITVKLAENPWSGSQVNVAVAKILLEKRWATP